MSANRFVVGMAAGGILSVALLVAPREARADEAFLLGTRHKSYESPQNFAIELRGGSYRPEVDLEPGLTGGKAPYFNTFGGRRALVALELDWQALRIPYIGTIGPGLSIGYTKMSAQAKIAGTQVESAQDTSLMIIPMYGVAVFRLDVFMREFRIPFVPYAKAGIGWGLWSVTSGGELQYRTDAVDTQNLYASRGSTWGTHFAAGVAFHLNDLDQRTAKNFDSEIGVNHTYIFLEAMRMNLNGLGESRPMFLGDTTWATGLAFEF